MAEQPHEAEAQEPGLQLVHLLRGITVQFDLFGARFAADNGLHPTDVRALIQLLDADRAGIEATPGWLGGRLGLNSAAVTALVDRLERLGHIRRERDTRDRRRVLLGVEPRAVALGWSFFGPLIERMVAGMRDFDESELATVQRFLEEMDQAVADVRNSAAAPGADPGHRRFVPRMEFAAMSADSPAIDLQAFRADQDAALDQEAGGPHGR